MEHLGTIVLETDRVILKQFKLSDYVEVYNNYANNDNVTKYLTWHTHKSQEDSLNYLQTVIPNYINKNYYNWAVVLKESDQVVGSIAIVKINEEEREATLGWVLGESYWGKGLMPECAKVVIKLLKQIGFKVLNASHHIENEKSGKAMTKIGLQFVKIDDGLDKYGKKIKVKSYSMELI